MKIIFLPDMLLPNKFKSKNNFKKLNSFLSAIREKFNNYEFFLNLETPILSKKTQALDKKNYNLYTNEDIFDIIAKHNIKNLSLSNNHIFDYGYDGFAQTLKILKKNKINFFGAGKDLTQARKPIIFNEKNKCAVFGMSYKPPAKINSPGILNLKDQNNLNFIKNFKQKNKNISIIIYCHSGLELFEYPLTRDELIYKKLIDYGADLIIGSHPHRIQGFEKYKNKFIFYSIGDLYSENVTKKAWNNYITKPAHASIYKNDLDNKIIFESYMLDIDTKTQLINLYQISRDRYFNYRIRKINKKKMIQMGLNFKKKINSQKIRNYRKSVEKQIFKNIV